MSPSLPNFMHEGWPKRVRNRLFHLLFLLRRPMTLGVRGVVYDRDANSVFLIRHTYVPGWQFPGGGVERGESTFLALARELEEEGNIELTGTPALKSIHFNVQASPRDHVALFLVTEFRQTTPKLGDIEIAEAGFFPLDALPSETTPSTLRRIAELFGDEEASPLW
jgi:8-oxo-dGTP pyrophosphatase MutT (NUDIX family)